ncbi:MAG: hypothetical protein GC160_29245 [Acidobacteria bacterium]|nr:hypothetical protein [Acidobacteriota bacterium]
MLRLCGLILAAALPMAAQTLTATPSSLNFQAEVGQPSPAAQKILVETSPAGEVFSAVVEVSIINPDWLSLLPTNGTTPGEITVRVDSSRFTAAGSRTANIRITLPASGKILVVPVTVEVAPAGQQPRFSAAPPNLSFTVSTAGVTPQPKQILLDNSGGGILNYQVGVNYPASGPQGWLQVTPASGTASFNSQSHNVSVVSTTGLAQGTYSAQVLFTGNASNSPFVVPVTLVVGSRPAVTATPASLSFTASQDGAFPDIQTVSIRNEGGGPLQYDIRGDQAWLFVRPLRGDATVSPVLHEVVPDIRGLPQGVFLGNLIVTSTSLDAPFLIPVRLTVGPPTQLFTLPTRLSFIGNSNIPSQMRRIISLVNTPLAAGRYTATVTPPEATWLKVTPESGEIPGHLVVEVDTRNLGADTLSAEIEIKGREGTVPFPLSAEEPQQAVATARVPVTLTVQSNPPQLGATPPYVRFRGVAGTATVLEQVLQVENFGGPQLNWESHVETDNGGDWLSVSPTAGEAPTMARVAANTSALAAGVYHGRIRLVAGSQSVTVPVAFVLLSRDPNLEPDLSGVFWETTEGGPQPPNIDVRVVNRGIGQGSWSVQTREISGPNWLGLSPSAGVSNPNGLVEPQSFELSPNTTGLAAGEYEALVEVRPSAGSSPRMITASLRVLPASQTTRRSITPGGLVFVAAAGESPQERTVEVRRNRAGETAYQLGASTVDGADWLVVTPDAGTTTTAGTAEFQVSVDTTGLSAGVRRGQVSVTYGDGLVETAFVTLIVPPPGPGACRATQLAVTPLSPYLGFRALAGRAVQIRAMLHDDCGRLVENAAALAAFESGDAALPLKPLGGGRYGVTWAPSGAATQGTIVLTAVSGSLSGQARIVGAVEGSSLPLLSPYGVVNGASFAGGEGVAPGSIVSLFGRSLASTSASAEQIPLPTTLSNAKVWIGGRPAPLYFASLGQINAQAPVDLFPGGYTQAVAKVGERYTVPVEIPVAAARPGIFRQPNASGPSRAIVQNQNGALNAASSPARRGEAIVVYLTGIGATDPSVVTGAASPDAEPLARASLPFSAKIGDKDAPVLFLGMTPGFVGLAQANILVPADAPIGSAIALELTVDGQPDKGLIVSIAAAP